jgi:FAD-dependent oxidoreductase domain-containing protein 1
MLFTTLYNITFQVSDAIGAKTDNFFRKLGAKNELLTPVKLKQKFPWINTDGIALGCHGLENEGW